MSKQPSQGGRGIFVQKFLKPIFSASQSLLAFFTRKRSQPPTKFDLKPYEPLFSQATLKTEREAKPTFTISAPPAKEYKVDPEEYEIFKTQFPGIKKTRICDVVIGLDFGTSCTKVVLRTPFFFGNRAFAVPFRGFTPSKNPYLLPSRIWLTPSGEFLLKEAPGCQSFSGIKLNLLEQIHVGMANREEARLDFSPPQLAVAYLALVLRFVREWFLNNKKDIYGNFRLRWHINLGLPSADFDDESLYRLYQKILRAAFDLSLKPEGIKTTDLPETFEQIQEDAAEGGPWENLILDVIPEVAAAVAGYARSSLRDPRGAGLHLLVDIGAGTLDVCGFFLHQKEGSDQYWLHAKDVKLLGVIKLHQNRLAALNGMEIKYWDPYDTENLLPTKIEDYFSTPPTSDVRNRLRKADEEFSARCQETIRRVVFRLRTQRDPLSSCWQDFLPVFICGGGSNVSFYKEVLEKISKWVRLWSRNKGLKIFTLPKPENFEVEFTDQYHRLTVALGLSFPKIDIGECFPTRNSEDILPFPATPKTWEELFISKDEV